ncbi:E3 ubiquitin-protein ligase rnf8 isoform X2 [Denticeps clupeoides]|uniref:E3 ubiquitin-protein ligase rnf8 isoform X2 n=2 Tax=Denticeps clupeoides TaxID=299321 RepID=UPI0010A45703|nr:E3 ubiquitin-protein ligase RNF8 isoform X2 [Denticeps clupeoides]
MEQTACPDHVPAEDQSPPDGIWCLQRVGQQSNWLQLHDNQEVTIGRAMNVTYQILSDSCPLMISRTHCTLKQKANSQWTVTDNKSLNGVWVNRNRLPAGSQCPLELGDHVQLGVSVDNNPAEFQYILVRRPLRHVEDFLKKPLVEETSAPPPLKPVKTKRKYSMDELAPGTSVDSNSKLYRGTAEDKSSARPCPAPPQHRKCPASTRASEQAGPSMRPPPPKNAAGDRSGAVLDSVLMFNQHLRDLLAEQELRELLEGQLQSQGEQVLGKVEAPEASSGEQEGRLEVEKAEQKVEGLRKQLEEAVHEHRKVFEELKAKDKELAMTKEEKEKATAQKEEVEAQMADVLENELQCIICSELFIEAVTLNCAHSFCQYCIRQWRRRKDECPTCRRSIQFETRSLVLDNCIDRMVEKLSGEMKQRRQALITERKGERPDCREISVSGGSSSGDHRDQ